MKKSELIKEIAVASGQTVAFTKEFFDIFKNVLIEAIKHNKEVHLSSKIGKFTLKTRKARTMINTLPTGNGETIKIPAKTAVIFKISKTIKDAVKDVNLNKIN